MSQQKRQRHEEDDNNISALDSSVDTTIDDGNGNEPLVKELKRKLAASEVTNTNTV
jgi:hypothetical protein